MGRIRWRTVSIMRSIESFQLLGRQGLEKLGHYLDLPPPGTGLAVPILFLDRHGAHHGLLPSQDDDLLALAGLFDQPRELCLRLLDGYRRHLFMLAQSGRLNQWLVASSGRFGLCWFRGMISPSPNSPPEACPCTRPCV